MWKVSNLYREPNRHTCPDIDELQDTIRIAPEEVSKFITYHFYNASGTLEQLRRSNDELRSWGNDLVSHSKELEDRINELEDQLSLANSTIEELESQVEELKEVKP